MLNLEELTVFHDYGKNDVYERLIAKSPDNRKNFIKKTYKSILDHQIFPK